MIHIPPEHVENPPVSEIALLGDDFSHLARDHLITSVQQTRANFRKKDDDAAIDDQHAQDDGKNDVPEPQEDVGFLVDDVER